MSADDKARSETLADKVSNTTQAIDHDSAQLSEDAAVPEERVMTPMEEIKDMAKTVGMALLLVLLLRTLLFQPFTIPSASMEPNLYEGDYIIVSKWDYGYSKHSILFSPPIIEGRVFDKAPTRGDVVVFKLPSDTRKDYIKRVIGLPGDTIQVRRNQLFINDKIVPGTNLAQIAGTLSGPGTYGDDVVMKQQETLPNGKVHDMQDGGDYTSGDDTEVFTVPAGHYFMMGDNRDNSTDSRFAPEYGGVGFVPAENIEGKAQFILMSWKPGSSIYKPWTWLNLRWNRFFKPLH